MPPSPSAPADDGAAAASEVPEAVGDEVSVVELHAAQHVRAVADHDVGTGIDHGVGEGPDVAAVLVVEDLRAIGGVRLVGPLGAHVRLDHDDVGLFLRLLHQFDVGRDVVDVVVGVVGREADDGHLRALDVEHGVGAGSPSWVMPLACSVALVLA